jgi:hypothetical protein
MMPAAPAESGTDPELPLTRQERKLEGGKIA